MKAGYIAAALCVGGIVSGGLTQTFPAKRFLKAAPQAAQGAKKPGAALDAARRQEAIEGILALLKRQYVFPEVAVKMETAIQERAAKGEYDKVADGPELADRLTRDLQEVCHDRHLRVGYSPETLPIKADWDKPTPDEARRERESARRENYGIEKAEVLPGNIGYLKIDYFTQLAWMQNAFDGAMNALADTDALIIDLRQNRGSGDEKTIPYVCGYFFEKPTLINSLYWRPTGKTTDYFSVAQVNGKRYLNKPIYLLTSRQTFSGAEEFAYDLKNLKRATLIGETTGGGANGGGDIRATDHFFAFVPVGRAINPITKTNWEGVGVAPDKVTPAWKSLYFAHLAALRYVTGAAQTTAKEDSQWQDFLKNAVAKMEANPPQSVKTTFTLKGYPDAKSVTVAGTFNNWSMASNPLAHQGDKWAATIEAEPGRHLYKFIVDGQWMTDPDNPETALDGQYKNSVRTIP